MGRIFLLTLMLLSVAATAAGVSPASAQDKLSVRLDFSPWGVQAAMHLAQNKGWFKEANLDVDIQDGRGSGNTIQLVNLGQADVGQGRCYGKPYRLAETRQDGSGSCRRCHSPSVKCPASEDA